MTTSQTEANRTGVRLPEGYFPHTANRFLLPAIMLCPIFGLMGLGQFLLGHADVKSTTVAVWLAMTVGGGWLSKRLYDVGKQGLYLTEEGLLIVNDGKIRLDFCPWAEIGYGYETANYKGQRFLVLSKDPLTPKQVRLLMRRHDFGMKIHLDGAVMLWHNSSRSASDFFDSVKAHISIAR